MTALTPDPALRSDPALKLILGSGSPRRRELLTLVGITPFAVRPPDIDEALYRAELPRDYVNRIAAQKAAAVHIAADEVLLCADTTVALGRRVLGKPADATEARKFLAALSGRRHKVITAVAVKRGGRVWQKDVQTTVMMKSLSQSEIDWYIGTGDWKGKAGGYAIQGPACAFCRWLNGSFHAVMGLPLPEVLGMLKAAGYPVTGERP